MKYKMTRYGNDTTNGAYSYDEIVELEPLDCPASECDGGECECIPNQLDNLVKNGSYFPKESLAKKMAKFCLGVKSIPATFFGHKEQVTYEDLEQIAKKHYQQNPEELFSDYEYLKEKGCFKRDQQ